jgi:hypothetical protein
MESGDAEGDEQEHERERHETLIEGKVDDSRDHEIVTMRVDRGEPRRNSA